MCRNYFCHRTTQPRRSIRGIVVVYRLVVDDDDDDRRQGHGNHLDSKTNDPLTKNRPPPLILSDTMFITLLSTVEKKMMEISDQAVDAVMEVEVPALTTIFSFLDFRARERMRLVSKHWKESVDQCILEQPKIEIKDHAHLKACVDVYCARLPDVPPVLHHRLGRMKKIVELCCGNPIGTWNVSKVKEFHALFREKVHFNESLEDWDVSNAETMAWMFHEAAAFNQPLGKWDVRKVVRMSGMFLEASSFNQDLSSWNTDNVKFPTCMFERSPIADRYRQDLQLLNKWGWDIMVSRLKEKLSKEPLASYYLRRGDTPHPVDEAVWDFICDTSTREI